MTRTGAPSDPSSTMARAGPHLLPPAEPLVHEPRWAGGPAAQGHAHPLCHHLRLRLLHNADRVLDWERREQPGLAETPLHQLVWSCPIPAHHSLSSSIPLHPTAPCPIPPLSPVSATSSYLSYPVPPTPPHPIPSHPTLLCSTHLVTLYPVLSHSVLSLPILSLLVPSQHDP